MREYPRAQKYDKSWVEQNWMGPHPLWLLEDLCEHMDLRPGMKVLDLGCGRGITSVFLAREYGVYVFATDLWISATDNLARFEEAGVADKVFPMHAQAHALPYAKGFFDAAIALDSYHYFGASETYFPDIFSKLVKHGGQFGIVVPGLSQEFEKGYPQTLEKFWLPELFSFHSKGWWRNLWEKTGIAEITACYDIENPKNIWESWAKWAKANIQNEFKGLLDSDDAGLNFDDYEFLKADTNHDLRLIALTARKIK